MSKCNKTGETGQKLDENKEKTYQINGKAIEFEWPLYIPSFPLGRSPAFTEKVHQKSTEIFLMNNRHIKAPVGYKSEVGLWAAFAYHTCLDSHRMEVLSLISHYIFCMDDMFSSKKDDAKRDNKLAVKNFSDVKRGLDKLCGEALVEAHEWNPCVIATLSALDSVMITYSDVQKKRLRDALNLFLNGCITECQVIDGVIPQFETVDKYLEIRHQSIGMVFMAQLIEYMHDIEVPDHDWKLQHFQDLLIYGSRLLFLLNDLFSFRKEIVDCDADLSICYNIIALYIAKYEFTIQVAFNKLVELMKSTEERVLELIKSIKERPGIDSNTIIFVDKYRAFLGGIWLFHLGVKRYNGEHKGLIPLSGKFIFNVNQTVIIPDYDINKYAYLNKYYNI